MNFREFFVSSLHFSWKKLFIFAIINKEKSEKMIMNILIISFLCLEELKKDGSKI